MKRILGLLAALAMAASARADSFFVIGSIQDGFSGPAAGATVTLCEYGGPSNGFVETRVVPPDGFVSVVIPYQPVTVAFEVEGDPVYLDVHVVVAQTICPVSPCNPNQSASFEVRLQRRPALPIRIDRVAQETAAK